MKLQLEIVNFMKIKFSQTTRANNKQQQYEQWLNTIKYLRLLQLYINTGIISHIDDGFLKLVSVNDPTETKVPDKESDQMKERLLNLLTTICPNYPFDIEESQFVQCLSSDHGKLIKALNELISATTIDQISMNTLQYLNGRGHIWGVNMNLHMYKTTVINQYRNLLSIETILHNPFNSSGEYDLLYQTSEQIPFDHLNAQQIQNRLKNEYDIQVTWVAGFYSSSYLPLFAGGVSYEMQANNLTIMQLSPSLKHRTSIGTLNRNELIMHELVHSSRMGLDSTTFEEEFAYGTSTSRIRRLLAPITQRPRDSILFSLFSMFSIASDLPKFPRYFSILSKFPIFALMAIGVIRLFIVKRTLRRAERYLRENKVRHPKQMLFRCSDKEIFQIARMSGSFHSFITSKAKTDIRWFILYSCYFSRK